MGPQELFYRKKVILMMYERNWEAASGYEKLARQASRLGE